MDQDVDGADDAVRPAAWPTPRDFAAGKQPTLLGRSTPAAAGPAAAAAATTAGSSSPRPSPLAGRPGKVVDDQWGLQPLPAQPLLPPAAATQQDEDGGEGPARALQSGSNSAAVNFFKETPYAIVYAMDTNDGECDKNTESPPVNDKNEAGYPRDGTDALRKLNAACGVAPVRFVFKTSDYIDYEDETVTANMQVKIMLQKATFRESDTCDAVLDAVGNFPTLSSCRFLTQEARITLGSKRLLRNTEYSLTVKLRMPASAMPASENSFVLGVYFYQLKTIEQTKSPLDITHTIPNAKNPVTGVDFTKRGYVTSFTWQPTADYSSEPNAVTLFTFGLRSFGTMSEKVYAIDIAAYPSDVWRMGKHLDPCNDGWSPPVVGATCRWRSLPGSSQDTMANGFRIQMGTTPLLPSATKFSLRITNPSKAINSIWTATSFRIDNNKLMHEPYTVLLDKPVSVLGKPTGNIAEWELSAINAEQWVTMELLPGNTLQPVSDGVSAYMVITPPPSFTVVDSVTPQDVPGYNALPCSSWPEEYRRQNRWVCLLQDKVPFAETVHRVKLKVRNPSVPGAAFAWRVELWQQGASKPISITRDIRGMPVLGSMTASLAPMNQLLESGNIVTFEFIASQDMGQVENGRLKVTAPEGFVIIKRCLDFKALVLPACECRGSDANFFELVFPTTKSIKAFELYKFQVKVQNPLVNIGANVNFWRFQSVRPDGIGKDMARYAGFFLYPQDFQSFVVLPVPEESGRKAGPRDVVVRFVSRLDVPFDDYIRVRAPAGVHWDINNLNFQTTNAATNANEMHTGDPMIPAGEKNTIIMRLEANLFADFEYGFRAQVHVPEETPVPNRWWIEQYRQTGKAPPAHMEYVASKGTEGYKTQTLVGASIQPYNQVEEAWENPTLVVFETTTAVTSRITSRGTVLNQAEFLLVAPPLFTYICPLSPTLEMPEGASPLPDDVDCVVNHSVEAERRMLHLYFRSGLEANKKYAFTIDLVNPMFVNPTSNYFHLFTLIDEKVIETAKLDGFPLATRMDNTRYVGGQSGEDRRVEASRNKISFVLGITVEMAAGAVLQVKAPKGFKFDKDCTTKVGKATWIGGLNELPAVASCENLVDTDPKLSNVARIRMAEVWTVGSYAMYVIVENPSFTPAQNNWAVTIYDGLSMVAKMAEAWIQGFRIMVVLDPILDPKNAANAVPGEAAPNPVDFMFKLQTRLPDTTAYDAEGGMFMVVAPKGFLFPMVCRQFFVDLKRPGVLPLPTGTTCQGDGDRTLKLLITPKRHLKPEVTYGFRCLVENPSQTFSNVADPERWWTLETRRADGAKENRYDLNYQVHGFPVYQRIRSFNLETLSRIGLKTTTLKIIFNVFSPLDPQKTIKVISPTEVHFGEPGSVCSRVDDSEISKEFEASLISDVTRLPEWVTCFVESINTVVLKNNDPVRGGRPLISGPTYEFYIQGVTNPQSTPELNLWRIQANTTSEHGKEIWAMEGYEIFPELTSAHVSSYNPGEGLYTTFTFTMKTVTEVPEGGSIRIEAPKAASGSHNDDYYFGPRLRTPGDEVDPLDSNPPPAGSSPDRPPEGTVVHCHIMPPPEWVCIFDLKPCVELEKMIENEDEALIIDEALKNDLSTQCSRMQLLCNGDGATVRPDLMALFDYLRKVDMPKPCISYGPVMEITLSDSLSIPGGSSVVVEVSGYNGRYAPRKAVHNEWHFQTRNADSAKSTLDEKKHVQGFHMLGVVYVDSIVASKTKVSTSDNQVTLVIRLSSRVPPTAQLVITHPEDFAQGISKSKQVRVGENIPRKAEKTHTGNTITIEVVEESLQRDVELEITITLPNPPISPAEGDNIWKFETFTFPPSGDQETKIQLDVNYDVKGFKIYGDFRSAQVAAFILSPSAATQDVKNIVGIWFILESDLPPGGDFSKADPYMRIWLPEGFEPMENCGTESYSLSYTRRDAGLQFPEDKEFQPLPSGTTCSKQYDPDQGYYILLKVDMLLDYGIDYAFEFGMINAKRNPPDRSKNVWRFETLMNNVILHLKRDVESFNLEEIKRVVITPTDTTSLMQFNRIEFSMMSDKFIPGGSKIKIRAPRGFVFTCVKFRVRGLANTTICSRDNRNRANVEFTVDTQAPLDPNFAFTIIVYVYNPEFTPQPNTWGFDIISPLGRYIDIRDAVEGFDITGALQTQVKPDFPYKGQRNKIFVVFVPSTIMNQADLGNELHLTAPSGYTFTANCTRFDLQFTNTKDLEGTATGMNYKNYPFPPPGTQCIGYNNNSVTVRLPQGTGLLRNNYTMIVDVTNPQFEPNQTNTWSFVTRVRNDEHGLKIVDANRTLGGFVLKDLEPVVHTENAASRRWGFLSGLIFSGVVFSELLSGLVPAMSGRVDTGSFVA